MAQYLKKTDDEIKAIQKKVFFDYFNEKVVAIHPLNI